MDEWAEWEFGDVLCAPDRSNGPLEQKEILRRVVTEFRRVVIDWLEGNRWVESRIRKAVEIGYQGFLLDVEHALRDRSVLVSVADAVDACVACVKFFMTPDTDVLELHYEPVSAAEACRALASKLGQLLGYEFVPRELNGTV